MTQNLVQVVKSRFFYVKVLTIFNKYDNLLKAINIHAKHALANYKFSNFVKNLN